MSGLESLSGNPTRGCCKQPHAAVAKLGASCPPSLLLFEMNQTGSRRNHSSSSLNSWGWEKRPPWLLAPIPGPLFHSVPLLLHGEPWTLRQRERVRSGVRLSVPGTGPLWRASLSPGKEKRVSSQALSASGASQTHHSVFPACPL